MIDINTICMITAALIRSFIFYYKLTGFNINLVILAVVWYVYKYGVILWKVFMLIGGINDIFFI